MPHAKKSNGLDFLPLENRVAPMVIKIAETIERTLGTAAGDGGGDNKQAMMKIAKQIKKTQEATAEKRQR